MTKNIDLIYFNAGGGHRSAALALQEVCRTQGRPWNVRLINLFEVLDPDGSFRRLTGFAPEDLYNLRLRRGWTMGLTTELKILQGMIRMSHASLVQRLERHWKSGRPDLVVSLVPNFIRPIYDSLRPAFGDVRFMTVMTDLADNPPNFWIEPGLNQRIVCGTPRAFQQACDAGYPPSQVTLVSGMILRPSFYRDGQLDRTGELRKLGLDPERPTGLVGFGGHGSSQMLKVAKSLEEVQLILLCGHNEVLARHLSAQKVKARHVVIGFTPDIERYMAISDFFIGKPGPGSLSEAVHMRLPVITFKNAWTMPQERYNTTWVKENNLGIVVSSLRDVQRATTELLANLPTFHEATEKIRNRAVFEVVDILAQQAMPVRQWATSL